MQSRLLVVVAHSFCQDNSGYESSVRLTRVLSDGQVLRIPTLASITRIATSRRHASFVTCCQRRQGWRGVWWAMSESATPPLTSGKVGSHWTEQTNQLPVWDCWARESPWRWYRGGEPLFFFVCMLIGGWFPGNPVGRCILATKNTYLEPILTLSGSRSL